MLKIKKSFRLKLPNLTTAKPMQLSPVPIDDDELTSDVSADADNQDNNWELTDRPDSDELEAYWNTVEADVRKDPTWFRMND